MHESEEYVMKGISSLSSEMDSDDEDDCWDEVVTEDQAVTCVFCDNSFQTCNTLWEHCALTHLFDINHFRKKIGIDFYGYIKLVNFLRKEKPGPKMLLKCTPPYPWENESFLQPVIPDDPLLQYDIEDSDSEEDKNYKENRLPTGSLSYNSNDEREEILKRMRVFKEKARDAESTLLQVLSEMELMRATIQSLKLSSDEEKVGNICGDLEDEDGYFTTYSHYSIHEEMLKDKVRTLSYKNFMHDNHTLFEGKVVLDIGCGSGILSIFAAQAGARKVIGVDKSSIVYHAMDIVRENKFDNVITLKRGKVEEVDLEVKQVDIIISEWMGYFLLFESMLDTVLFARDKWLAPGGKVYPDHCTMSLVGLADNRRAEEKLNFWEDVYGIKMSCMKQLVLSEPVVDIIDPNCLLTGSCIVKEINVNKVRTEDLDFKNDFQLEVFKDGMLNIIVGYFDIFFEEDCTHKISFSTHPESPATHWKQTIFLLENPVSFQKGEVIHGRIECKKNVKDLRALDIVLQIQDNSSGKVLINKYTLQ